MHLNDLQNYGMTNARKFKRTSVEPVKKHEVSKRPSENKNINHR